MNETPRPVWWMGWTDEPKTSAVMFPAVPLKVWYTGGILSTSKAAFCARAEAVSEEEAWAAVEEAYPGALQARRFSARKEPGWWPPLDRFPL